MTPKCKWCGSWRSVQYVRVEGRTVTALCTPCWRIYAETGERPPAYRMRDPQTGPITGRPFRVPR